MPLIRNTEPKVYITSNNSIGAEPSVVLFLKALGIKTLTWLYGTNSYLFTTKTAEKSFRNPVFSNITTETLVVWNEHYKEYIRSHPQNGLKIVTMGPLMSGDEHVTKMNKEQLCETIGIKHIPGTKYVAAFDSPVVTPNFRGNSAWCPDSNTPEYNYKFISDLHKLISDNPDTKLIYKPKRSLKSGKFHYSDDLLALFNSMEDDPNVIFIDYNINPWIPIAIADICISMPFESPTIVALHYQKPGIFHDPDNIALHHRYDSYPEILTHNYHELKERTEEYLLNSNIFNGPKFKHLKGASPGTPSSDNFRELLVALA